MLIELLHSRSVFGYCSVVSFLRARKSASVHTIVDVWINPLIDLCHLLLQRLWFEVKLRILGEIVELTVQESDYFRRLVTDNSLELLVPKDGHRVLSMLVVCHFIEIPHELDTVVRFFLDIINHILAKAIAVRPSCVFGSKGPATVFILTWPCLSPYRVSHLDVNNFVETLHVDDSSAAVGPGTSP